MIRAFEPSFVTQYQPAFTELVRLGSVAAQKKVQGKDTLKEDDIAQRLFIVLQALDSDGLSVKQVDALEYCLLRLNESLSGPTVEALVNVSLTTTPSQYTLRAWAGLFNLSGQDVDLDYGLVAEHGVFALSGQDVSFIFRHTLTAEVGSFSLSGQDADLVFYRSCLPGPYSYYLANRYSCVDCSLVESDVLVSLPTSITAVIGDFYVPCVPSDDVYELTGTSSSGVAVILNNDHSATCEICKK